METSWPWDGITDGDAALLAPYDEQEWDDNERMMFGSGGNNGVLANPYGLNKLAVTQRGAGANMSVDVDTGAALVYGKRYKSTATVNLAIAANASGNPRIDRVVAVWNRQAVGYAGVTPNINPKTCRVAVLQGVPAGAPAAPALTQNPATVYMIPLAQVYVANGAVSITNANITSEREFVQFATERTRYLFVPATVGYNQTDDSVINLSNSAQGGIQLPDNKVSIAYGRLIADADMSNVVVQALLREVPAGNVYAQTVAQYGGRGETYSTHGDTTGYAVVATAGGANVYNVHTSLALASLTAGDIVTLTFTRNAVNALDTAGTVIMCVGFMVAYTGDN